jgi:hypothetical protein
MYPVPGPIKRQFAFDPAIVPVAPLWSSVKSHRAAHDDFETWWDQGFQTRLLIRIKFHEGLTRIIPKWDLTDTRIVMRPIGEFCKKAYQDAKNHHAKKSRWWRTGNAQFNEKIASKNSSIAPLIVSEA